MILINTMTEIKKTRDTVIVPSHMLNRNIRANMLALMRMKEGTCSKKGYIVRLLSLDKIHSGRFCTADSNNHFVVEYSYEILTPRKGDVYDATVFRSYPDGMLATVDIYPALRIMTPPGNYIPGNKITIVLEDVVFHGDMCTCVGIVE